MLDQNTDRMWYVIGAVIIGAAIILILNGTMPQLFASVAETFEDKTDDVSSAVSDMDMAVGSGENLLLGTSDDWVDYPGLFQHAGGVGQSSAYRLIADMGLAPGDMVTFSGDFNFYNGHYGPRINFSPVPYDTDDEREMARRGKTHTGKGKFTYTVKVPENTVYLRVMISNQNEVNGSAREDVISIRKLKLEKGIVAYRRRGISICKRTVKEC